MRVAVTGGAGFIGSHFVDECVSRGWDVRVVDNLRTGRYEFINPVRQDEHGIWSYTPMANFHKVDIVTGSMTDLYRAFDGCDWVAHFAANADVRYGFARPFFDIEQNIIGTHRVLEAMRGVGVKKVFFASTASVYGDLQMDAIPEDAPFPRQQSLYGTSKVAAEGLISSYVEGFDFTGLVGRWVQIIGERYLHGHVIDFVRKLKRDPELLEILGSGTQRKSGLYVKDLVRGIADGIQFHDKNVGTHNVYNFGTDSTFSVFESADLISAIMQVKPKYLTEWEMGMVGGWVGDNPMVLLDSSKAKKFLKWEPTVTVPEAIDRTVRWLLSDECTYL